jgi:hypothetical protein
LKLRWAAHVRSAQGPLIAVLLAGTVLLNVIEFPRIEHRASPAAYKAAHPAAASLHLHDLAAVEGVHIATRFSFYLQLGQVAKGAELTVIGRVPLRPGNLAGLSRVASIKKVQGEVHLAESQVAHLEARAVARGTLRGAGEYTISTARHELDEREYAVFISDGHIYVCNRSTLRRWGLDPGLGA